jgi:hypothetical protein
MAEGECELGHHTCTRARLGRRAGRAVVEARCDACGAVTYRFVDANYDHRTYSRAADPRARIVRDPSPPP